MWGILGTYELSDGAMDLSSTAWPNEDGLTLGALVGMMFVDAALWAAIGWYLDKVCTVLRRGLDGHVYR